MRSNWPEHLGTMIWEGKTDSAMKSSGSGTFTATSLIMHLDSWVVKCWYNGGMMVYQFIKVKVLNLIEVCQISHCRRYWQLWEASSFDNAKFISRWSLIMWGRLRGASVKNKYPEYGGQIRGERLHILAVKRNIHLTKHLEYRELGTQRSW